MSNQQDLKSRLKNRPTSESQEKKYIHSTGKRNNCTPAAMNAVLYLLNTRCINSRQYFLIAAVHKSI